jgi:hypothetical protein
MSGGGVRRIEVTERESPVFGGTEFGAVGSYERLHGTVFGELDPRHPLNAGIVNLDRAVRNSRGNVEYRSEVALVEADWVSGEQKAIRVKAHMPVTASNGSRP